MSRSQSQASLEKSRLPSPPPWSDADSATGYRATSPRIKGRNKIHGVDGPARSRSTSQDPDAQALTTEAQLRRVVQQEMRDFLQFTLARAFESQQKQLECHVDRLLAQVAVAERLRSDKMQQCTHEGLSQLARLPGHSGSDSRDPGAPVDDDLVLTTPGAAGRDTTPIMLAALPEDPSHTEICQERIDHQSGVNAKNDSGTPEDPDMLNDDFEESFMTGVGINTSQGGTSRGQGQDATANPSGAAGHSDPDDAASHAVSEVKANAPFRWEWERSNNQGWKAYTRSENTRLELAWRSGASRVRLRSGQQGKTPVEIFFVDMLQQDPESLNVRKIRRVGRVPWWREPVRYGRAIFRQIRTGEPAWESFKVYQQRQSEYSGRDINHRWQRLERGPSASVNSDFFVQQAQAYRRQPFRYVCCYIYGSDTWFVVSTLATLANAIWIGIDAQRSEDVPLYEKRFSSIIANCFFCLFFSVELVIHLMTFDPIKTSWRSTWFCFDAVCVTGSVLEVVVWPILDFISNQLFRASPAWIVLRNVRLVRALRVCRVFLLFDDAGPFFKGLLIGMQNSLVVWGLLGVMLFLFSLMLRLNASQGILDAHFSSLWGAMQTLLVRGIMLDEVSSILDEIWRSSDVFTFVVFLLFVFLAHFNLLNMLIGTFCSVAGDSAAEEKEADQMRYLHNHLVSILDCYIAEEGKIGEREFKLIMKNADFYRTLAQAGTDMDAVGELKDQLFRRSMDVSFDDFFRAITHIRRGKVATVKDVLRINKELRKNRTLLEDIEFRIPNARPRSGP